jgi:probable rRNA maturation factor
MIDIQNTTKQNPLVSRGDFSFLKEKILGKKYELSLVFVGDTRSKKLNQKYRNKSYIPNVLSFPYSDSDGEIFINLKKSKSESKKNEMSEKEYIKFLFIHGCLHLKGMDHGVEMEKAEKKFLKI